MGDDAVELCSAVGLYLDPWQSLVLRASLAERRDLKWACQEVGLIVPRQNGKGAVLEARELVGLFLLGEKLILHSAHEFKTAREGFLRLTSLIENSDDLRRRVKHIRTSHGEEGVELLNGARLRFVARSRGSGRGFSGDLVIMDEAYALPDTALDALLPTLSARPNPQVWYTSSAPLPDSTVLRRICERGRAGGQERLAYFEWSAPAGAPRGEVETWAHANPAMGHRLSLDAIRAEFASMSPDGFDRERLGIFSDDDRERVIRNWNLLADPTSAIVGGLVFGIDISPDRSRASICVAGKREDGQFHVEVVDAREDAHWVVPRLHELIEKWGNLIVVLDDKSSAGSLITDLEKILAIDTLRPSFRDLAAGCARLYDACSPNVATLHHRGQPSLDNAVDGAITRPTGDAWLWDRRKPEVDITPLVAATLAYWGVTEGYSDFNMAAQVF